MTTADTSTPYPLVPIYYNIAVHYYYSLASPSLQERIFHHLSFKVILVTSLLLSLSSNRSSSLD